MIFKQDGNQRLNDEWQFMLYDSYGRPTVRGICRHANEIDIANTQVVSRFAATGKYAMYDASISINVKQLLKVNYYDGYAFLGQDSLYNYQKQDDYDKDINSLGNKVTTHGLLTGCRTYRLQQNALQTASNVLTESLYYNNRGEVVQTHKDNSIGGMDDVYYHRNPYTGCVLLEKIVHHSNKMKIGSDNDAIETIIKRYTYDKNGRLDSMMYKLNDEEEFLVKHFEYDDMGRVERTTSHADVLSTNYTYNVRG